MIRWKVWDFLVSSRSLSSVPGAMTNKKREATPKNVNCLSLCLVLWYLTWLLQKRGRKVMQWFIVALFLILKISLEDTCVEKGVGGRREETREERRETGGRDDLRIISLLSLHCLYTQRLCVWGWVCVYERVCVGVITNHLVDTLSRLSHHVLLLLPID